MAAVQSYRAHSLSIHSELHLPYVAAAEPTADLVIRRGSVEQAPNGTASAGALCRVDGQTAWIDVPGIARYRVDAGSIVVDAAPEIDEAAAVAFLTNTALGFALVARNRLVLEAAAVKGPGGAVLVLAHAGGGRSTLAAQLSVRGYGFLSDDVVVVTGRNRCARAHPGGNVHRIWPDVATHIGLNPAELAPVRLGVAKRLVAADPLSLEPLPIAGIVVLGVSREPEPSAIPIEAGAKFAVAHRHTFRNRVLRPFDLRRDHFGRLTRLVREVPVIRIERPRHGDHLDTVADLAETAITGWSG